MNIIYHVAQLTCRRSIRFMVLSFFIFLGLPAASSSAQGNFQIVVNQQGYYPDWTKKALIINRNGLERVSLKHDQSKLVAKIIKIRPFISDDETLDMGIIDFTEFKTPGTYVLSRGAYESAPFTIADNIYDFPAWSMLRSYYLQRCGVGLFDEYTGLTHPVCHHNDGIFYRDDKINKAGGFTLASGGWHDAGDYGKYIAPATAAVKRLLSLYTMAPQRYKKLTLNIPESHNGIPDILDEVEYELNWMVKMQRSDGAVYRKLSGENWTTAIPPEMDKQKRYIYGISSHDTGKFAATMALAARVYKRYNKKKALKYLKASKKAWLWLIKDDMVEIDWSRHDDKGSGSYLVTDGEKPHTTKSNTRERLSAAIELYLTTQKEEYREYILHNTRNVSYGMFDWKNPLPLSYWHLMMFDSSPEFKSLRHSIKRSLLDRADLLAAQVYISEYGLANNAIVWGSNKITAEEGITLAHAWHITGKKVYLDAALDQVNYLLGINPNNLSFLTGIGKHHVKNPVHLFAQASKTKIPGLLVGGPNAKAEDEITPKDRGLMSYVDHHRAYSVNEYAIDYNSAFIGLLEIIAIYRKGVKKSTKKGSSYYVLDKTEQFDTE